MAPRTKSKPSTQGYLPYVLYVRSSPVIELKGATLKFFKGIPSSSSGSSLRPQFAKLEQWQPFEILDQNTIFGGHYLAVFEITAFFSPLSQLFCFPANQ